MIYNAPSLMRNNLSPLLSLPTQSLPHSSILSEMLPVDSKEVIEHNSDHGERTKHVGEEVEGVMGNHLAALGGSSIRAGFVNEWMSGWEATSSKRGQSSHQSSANTRFKTNDIPVNTGLGGLMEEVGVYNELAKDVAQ